MNIRRTFLRCGEGGERKLGKSCGIYRQDFTLFATSIAENKKEGPYQLYILTKRFCAGILSRWFVIHSVLPPRRCVKVSAIRPRSMQQLLDTSYPASRGLNVKQVLDFGWLSKALRGGRERERQNINSWYFAELHARLTAYNGHSSSLRSPSCVSSAGRPRLAPQHIHLSSVSIIISDLSFAAPLYLIST